ncbi:MAG: S-methyl-5'-thioinosine phosphorylase [Mizugakiibacter sp.]|uniref:S-methyl-5'-thioinosine phosphorylase n=1 Tax=Mizugakiibacter sp. TaxID=1972610 RepID=UPI0031C29A4E|nr:S-methyl-5'-thioinosine phosphorylase [Xanthomonadaceae bacterium]
MALDLAVIGGTGLYQFPGIEVVERRAVETPYGAPSGAVVLGRFGGRALAFLARHGEDHALAPHRVNYRANLWALHRLGARRVLGVNAVGGIRADMGPRVLAVPDQIIDYTHGRPSSYSDVEGAKVEHIDFSEPYGAALRADLLGAAHRAGVAVVDGGCYGATQGPRLETRAEIARMRRDGCDLVGMTGMPEAALARELGLDYACLALVANWAAGCGDQAEISLSEIFANLAAATAEVPKILAALLRD